MGYLMTWWSYMAILHITILHYHHYAGLSEGIELLKCLSAIFCLEYSSLNYLKFNIWGCVYSAYPFFWCWLWEYLYFILSSPQNRTYLPLFKFKSWKKGMCCMSFCIHIIRFRYVSDLIQCYFTYIIIPNNLFKKHLRKRYISGHNYGTAYQNVPRICAQWCCALVCCGHVLALRHVIYLPQAPMLRNLHWVNRITTAIQEKEGLSGNRGYIS